MSIPTRDIIINLINRNFVREIDMGRNLADVEYKMRMTQDLKDKIVESAKKHNRSMNAEIVHRLEESFKNMDCEDYSFSDSSKHTSLTNKIDYLIYFTLKDKISKKREFQEFQEMISLFENYLAEEVVKNLSSTMCLNQIESDTPTKTREEIAQEMKVKYPDIEQW